MNIRQIIDKINDSQLFVPAFQREYVWKRPDTKALFTSLIKKYPTGTLLSWETTKPPELKGPKKYQSEMGAVKLILDGQQRITTIYMIVEGKLPPYYSAAEIKNEVTGLYVNLQTLDLEYYKQQTMQNNPLWIDLTDIFQGRVKSSDVRKRLKADNALNDELENLIDTNFDTVKSIQDREFPEQIIPVSASIREAIDIFYIVNASGVNLTDAELALAQISGYWPEARDLFKKKLFALEKEGFVFKLDFIVFALLAVLYAGGSEMKRLHGVENRDKIQAAWKRLDDQVLDYVANLLRTNAFVDHTDEINSSFALIPIIAYIFKKESGKLDELEIKKVIKWFYYSQLRQRYVSQTPQKLDRDLATIKTSAEPFDELLGVIEQERPLKIAETEFVGRDIRHPLFNLMKWYFKSQGAVCLGTGLSVRRNMGKKYTLENDHIFPYAALKANGYDVDDRFKYALAQEVTNRAVLTLVENRGKSDTEAKDYLSKAIKAFPSALKKQCIPSDESLWSMSRFEDFLAARRALLTTELNSFLDGITNMEPKHGMVNIEDIIAEGEHDALEFKSSLRWDGNQGKTNPELEKVVLKSIAAFNNGSGDGGQLIIGVDNDRNVLGLSNDYSTLKGNSRDVFELHLRSLISAEWGVDFCASSISISFYEIGGEDVCAVNVRKGTKPLFMKIADKSGAKVERFYVRSGNSSPYIANPSEISQYISKRFK
ncbi:MAG: GmrSD restriction endonuclease domain-containing protein [Pseudomonadota bacterium]